jgi:uncharacterized protein YjiS (DUF1127 family)
MMFRNLVERMKQRQVKRQTVNQFAGLTDVDLADMGLKRYQLEAKLQG